MVKTYRGVRAGLAVVDFTGGVHDVVVYRSVCILPVKIVDYHTSRRPHP